MNPVTDLSDDQVASLPVYARDYITGLYAQIAALEAERDAVLAESHLVESARSDV